MNNIIRIKIGFYSTSIYIPSASHFKTKRILDYSFPSYIEITEYIQNDATTNYRLWETLRSNKFNMLRDI